MSGGCHLGRLRFLLTGLAVDAGFPASLMSCCKRTFYLDESRIRWWGRWGQWGSVSDFLGLIFYRDSQDGQDGIVDDLVTRQGEWSGLEDALAMVGEESWIGREFFR